MPVQEQQQASAEQQANLKIRLAHSESSVVAAAAELDRFKALSADAAQVTLQDASKLQ